jgi:hypothetical protein
MHTSKAAGKLTDISYDDDTKTIEGVAKIVDGDEWEKVLEGVYTGFSMGGRYAKRWNDNGTMRYTAQPVEVSIVDKPCIKSALFDGMKKTFMLQKADGTIEERPFANKGDAMFVPTNDQILPVAQALAKAAGKTDADWLEFVDRLAISSLRSTRRSRRPTPEHTDEDARSRTAKSAWQGAAKADTTTSGGSRGSRRRRVSLMKGTTLGRVIRNPPPPLTNRRKGRVAGGAGAGLASLGRYVLRQEGRLRRPQRKARQGRCPPTLASRSLDDALAPVGARQGRNRRRLPPPWSRSRSASRSTRSCLSWPISSAVRTSARACTRSAPSLAFCAARPACTLRLATSGSGRRRLAVPAQLLDATEALGKALIDMATEEVGEMLTELREAGESDDNWVYPECCYLSASTMGLEKADADEFFTKAVDAHGKRGGAVAKAALVPVDGEDELSKAVKAAGYEDVAAFTTGIADLQKAAGELADIKPKVEELTKFITDLKGKPMPPAPTSSRAVEKAIDANPAGGGGGSGAMTSLRRRNRALAGLPPEEIARLAIKMSHAERRS